MDNSTRGIPPNTTSDPLVPTTTAAPDDRTIIYVIIIVVGIVLIVIIAIAVIMICFLVTRSLKQRTQRRTKYVHNDLRLEDKYSTVISHTVW